MGIKDTVKMHYEETKARKDMLKESKFNHAQLWWGIFQMVWGAIFFLAWLPSVWMRILAKILGVFVLFNGVGYIFKCVKVDEAVEAHAQKKIEDNWGKK